MPAHHVDLLTGIRAGIGGLAFKSPMMCGSRRKPVSGSSSDSDTGHLQLVSFGDVLERPIAAMAELGQPKPNNTTIFQVGFDQSTELPPLCSLGQYPR